MVRYRQPARLVADASFARILITTCWHAPAVSCASGSTSKGKWLRDDVVRVFCLEKRSAGEAVAVQSSKRGAQKTMTSTKK